MAVFLTLPEGSGHTELFFNRYGRKWSRHMSEITYANLAKRQKAPPGSYVFCDLQRMSAEQRRIAALFWDRLAEGGTSIRLLNDPRKELGRFELLRTLFENGTNDFNVWKLSEIGEQIRFPVFVRRENDHSGPRSALLENLDELYLQIAKLVLAGLPPEQVLVVEYCDTAQDGLFRKYGALRVGDIIYGGHILVSNYWTAKREHRLRTPEALKENADYYFENPHAELLRPIFDLAGIEYGRIDYSFRDGRIQVWEINDNPQLASANPSFINKQGKERTYVAALDALDEGLEPGPPVSVYIGTDIWDALRGGEAVPV